MEKFEKYTVENGKRGFLPFKIESCGNLSEFHKQIKKEMEDFRRIYNVRVFKEFTLRILFGCV